MSINRFFIEQYSNFESLPFTKLKESKFSIFIIDYNWVYRFVNDFAQERLKGMHILGKQVEDIWKSYPDLNLKPTYDLLNPGVVKRQRVDVKFKSPLTNKTIEIHGSPLDDCYYFSVTELPDKESLIAELKSFLKRS